MYILLYLLDYKESISHLRLSDMEVDNKTVVHMIPTKQVLVSGHAPEWVDSISLDGTPGSIGYITDSVLDEDHGNATTKASQEGEES